MKKNKLLITSIFAAMAVATSTASHAILSSNAALNFNPGTTTLTYHGTSVINGGSYFGMDTDGNSLIMANERIAIQQLNGIFLGLAQPASGSHSGMPDGTESPDIDVPWSFFANTGLHSASTPTTVLSASGNTATVDFSGWVVEWNGITNGIPMGSGAWEAGFTNGVAQVTCAVDCSQGDTYILNYSSSVPIGDPSGFGGVQYTLHLEGTVGSGVATTRPLSNNVNLLSQQAASHVWVPDVSDADGDPLTCGIVQQASQGIATVQADCSSGTYTPTIGASFSGTDSFTYKANDGIIDSIQGTVSVDISVSAPPVVSIDVLGGSAQECSSADGANVSVNANIVVADGDYINSIDWKLNGSALSSLQSINEQLSMGAHNLELTVTTQNGHSIVKTTTITVQDTTPPVVSANYINRLTGLPIDTMALNQNFIEVKASVSDVCDPAAYVTNAVYGNPTADGAIFLSNSWSGGFVIPLRQLELWVEGRDAAGNIGSATSLLYPAP